MDTAEQLTTGWEPHVPAGDSLARRFVLSYADRLVECAARTGGRSTVIGGAVLADLDSPFGYDNAVVLTGPPDPATLDAVLVAAGDFFPPQRWWVLLSLFALPDLGDRGLARVGHPPLMLRTPGPLLVPQSGLEIRAVPDADPADFESVLVEGFGLADVGRPAVADPRLVGGLLHLVVGYAGGAAVATAGAGIRHGVIEIDWVAVRAGHRGRGYGAAVTAAVCGVAPELPAMLISSDDAHPVYRRLGFWDLFRATMWEHPAA
ncbi:GNAT family N-acetyltransferase [Pseudonocardia nantongensis]|uniref:GNAT family N-acetyltransferase n=1 Tax=Pseudonocardia nantongensis TaxID=1181885 RepID=UPI00397D10AC